ncbi:hypothetical protein C8Q70DRAFT_516119 [Cubamyces menziesii]|uniref:Uncharacterized protein n=1 Tax=Trametes cubensis TaxID=1111947 RepID=A0AAD7XE17_9APHY|nr:hypothetical protein C8Q70DRAFT_516119 [Cubamyces menziesii]KAJ8494446.1 hypothetical protein ONZ51_g2315 [Trametes cubensis]
MGQGGYLSIYNTTPHEWRRTFQFAYQMNSWEFPTTIAPYTSVNIYIEFDEGLFTHTGDDKGEVNYELVGCPAGQAQFQLIARLRDLNANFIEFPARLAPDTDVPVGGKLNIGWRDNGVAVFILAGQHGNLHVLKNAA